MSASRYYIVINPEYVRSETLRRVVESLPDAFDSLGCLVFEKRNAVRVLDDGFGFENMTGVAVKRFKDPGWIRGLYYTYIGKTKAQRAYVNALKLHKRGIDTPVPIAYVEGRKGGVKRIGYLVTEKMELPPVKEDIYYEERFDEKVGEAYGAFVAELHAKGIIHHDLNCDNVLIDKAYTPPRFALIDVNRMEFAEHLTKEQRMRNLCLFTRSVANVRRVAAYYAHHVGLPAAFAEETAKYKRVFNARRRRRKRFTGLFKKRRTMS